MSPFTRYIIAVPPQTPAKIYADNAYGAGIVEAVKEDELSDFAAVHYVDSVEDEESLLNADSTRTHQADKIYGLITDRRKQQEQD